MGHLFRSGTIFIRHILDLFAYVDDSFSWDFANNLTYYPPYHKYLPDKQTKLLLLFDEIGVPHDERKQISGAPLTIIGLDVDPNAMTITMPPDARHDLISAIRSFANTRQRRTLRDFQRLAGWVNWALNAYPLLRPGLSCLYEKMFHRDSEPFQQLSVSVAISDELPWLANHIDSSDGVHIIKSQDWSRSDADDTYLSDACPSGMGYWSPKACQGFQCSIPPPVTAFSSLRRYQCRRHSIMCANMPLQCLHVCYSY